MTARRRAADRLPPLNALRAFETVARRRSVSLAARELHVTPSAVSHQLRALEDWLGGRLFRRSGRTLEPTDRGRAYLPAVSGALAQIAAATDALFLRGTEQTLHVDALPVFAVKWLVPRLGAFQRRRPDLDVRMTTSYRFVDLAAAGVDVAIRWGAGGWTGLVVEPLLRESVTPVCSPALARGTPSLRTPADLPRHTLVHMALAREDWALWCRRYRADGVDPRGGLRFDEPLAAIQAAIDGLGVMLGPRALVADDLARGALVVPFDAPLEVDDAYWVACREESLARPIVREFRDWLLETARA